jgi:CDP-glycerol glycerophosphotransferase (TagB/SpsB family)
MRAIYRRLRGLAGRIRHGGRPLVSVVVEVRGPADFLADCLDSILASACRSLEVLLASPSDDTAARAALDRLATDDERVRRLPAGGESFLDDAVAAAAGRYLAFATADDAVPTPAYQVLADSLEVSGSDFAVGVLHRQDTGRFRPPAWAATLFPRRRSHVDLGESPEALVDLGVVNKMFRASSWSEAGLGLAPADLRRAAVTVTRAYLEASAFDVLPDRVYDAWARDAARPVHEQERFSAARVHEHLETLAASWALVRGAGRPALAEEWLRDLAEFWLPPLYADAVGGGEPYFAALSSGVRALAGTALDGVLEGVSVHNRVCLWLATHAGLTDLALMLDLIGDSPHGLPLRHDGLVALPDGLGAEPPSELRRIRDVDRRVHNRLQWVDSDGTRLHVEGASLVDYAPGTGTPSVELVGDRGTRAPLPVEPRTDRSVNEWSRRAWEDHSTAGFTAYVDPGILTGHPDTTWHAELTVPSGSRAGPFHARTRPDVPDDGLAAAGGQHVAVRWDAQDGLLLAATSHRPSPRPVADVHVEQAAVADGRLRLTGSSRTGPALRWSLHGPRATTGPVACAVDAGRFVVDLELSVVQWGERTPLPADRYSVAVAGTTGEAFEVSWADDVLASSAADLSTDRLRVAVVPGRRDAAAVVVHPPLGREERGPFHQQRMIRTVYGSSRGPSYQRTVLFESFRGRGAGDNPGAICAELLRRDLDLDLDLVWVVDDPSVTVPAGTRAVARRSHAWFDVLGNARGYVSNTGAPGFFAKKDGQFHLQTWHGTPLKKIGEDRGPGDLNTWRHRRRIAQQSARWDGMVSPSRYCTEIFRSAFGYSGPMLETGYPRNDLLVGAGTDMVRARVRERLGVADSDRVVLYAPTWREYVGMRDAKPLYLDAERLTGMVPDSVVLVRGHYNSTHQADVFTGKARIRDVTRYPDIAELYLAADVLVTDYSSVMFDFSLTDKAVILLVPDLEQYRDVERDFYFDFEQEAPGPMVESTDQVVAALAEDDTFSSRRAAFRRRFCPWDDGSASARVVDNLLDRW